MHGLKFSFCYTHASSFLLLLWNDGGRPVKTSLFIINSLWGWLSCGRDGLTLAWLVFFRSRGWRVRSCRKTLINPKVLSVCCFLAAGYDYGSRSALRNTIVVMSEWFVWSFGPLHLAVWPRWWCCYDDGDQACFSIHVALSQRGECFAPLCFHPFGSSVASLLWFFSFTSARPGPASARPGPASASLS